MFYSLRLYHYNSKIILLINIYYLHDTLNSFFLSQDVVCELKLFPYCLYKISPSSLKVSEKFLKIASWDIQKNFVKLNLKFPEWKVDKN